MPFKGRYSQRGGVAIGGVQHVQEVAQNRHTNFIKRDNNNDTVIDAGGGAVPVQTAEEGTNGTGRNTSASGAVHVHVQAAQDATNGAVVDDNGGTKSEAAQLQTLDAASEASELSPQAQLQIESICIHATNSAGGAEGSASPPARLDSFLQHADPGNDVFSATTMVLRTTASDAHRGTSLGVMSPCTVLWAGPYDEDAALRRDHMSSHRALAHPKTAEGSTKSRLVSMGRNAQLLQQRHRKPSVMQPSSMHASMVRATSAHGRALLPQLPQCQLQGVDPPWAIKTTKSVLAELRAQQARYAALRERAAAEREANRPPQLDNIAARLAALIVPPKPPSAKQRWRAATKKIVFGIKWMGLTARSESLPVDGLDAHARQPTFTETVHTNQKQIGALEQMFLLESKASILLKWRKKARNSSNSSSSSSSSSSRFLQLPGFTPDDEGNSSEDYADDATGGRPGRISLKAKLAADKAAADQKAEREAARKSFSSRVSTGALKKSRKSKKPEEDDVDGALEEPAIVDYLHTTSVSLLVSNPFDYIRYLCMHPKCNLPCDRPVK